MLNLLLYLSYKVNPKLTILNCTLKNKNGTTYACVIFFIIH